MSKKINTYIQFLFWDIIVEIIIIVLLTGEKYYSWSDRNILFCKDNAYADRSETWSKDGRIKI